MVFLINVPQSYVTVVPECLLKYSGQSLGISEFTV